VRDAHRPIFANGVVNFSDSSLGHFMPDAKPMKYLS